MSPADKEIVAALIKHGHLAGILSPEEPLPDAVRQALGGLNFAQRLLLATAFEVSVRDALRLRGAVADLFAQGQLSPDMRPLLKSYRTTDGERSPVCWMTDVISGRADALGTALWFVDAKSGERWRDTGNHDIETAALETAEKWTVFSKAPAYFVFTDWGVASPAAIRESGKSGPWRGNGSGTPFMLFPTHCCEPFDEIFGSAGIAA